MNKKKEVKNEMTPEDLSLNIISIIVGFLISRFYYRKQLKDGKKFESLILSGMRIDCDQAKSGQRRGFPIQNPDGTWAVRWEVTIQEEKIGVSDKVTAEVIRGKKENQS